MKCKKILILNFLIMFVFCFVIVTYSFSDILEGLIAYYPFDGNANDLQHENNGIEFGGISYVNGIKNLAIQFDGIDDYIRINESDNLSFNSDSFSISFWFKANSGGFIMDERQHNDVGYYIILQKNSFKFGSEGNPNIVLLLFS